MANFQPAKDSLMSRSTLWRRKRSQRLMRSLSATEETGARSSPSEWYTVQHQTADWHESQNTEAQGLPDLDNYKNNERLSPVTKTFMLDEAEEMDAVNQSEDDTPDGNDSPDERLQMDEEDEGDKTGEWFDTEDTADWYDVPESSTLTEDLPLYTGSPITVCASMLLILNFAFCHGLTGECLSDLLVLISLHCLSPNHCLTSLYRFRKFFKNLKNPLNLHKFCKVCSYTIKDNNERCTVCNAELKSNMSYFIEIPLAGQIRDLFSRPGFSEELQHRFKRKKRNENNIEDIYDGILYREQFGSDGFLNDPHNISLMWYTDGVPLFKSSKFNIWPICFTINELPYAKRTKTENILVGGLWFGESKPCMLSFWEPIAKSLKTLKTNGVMVDSPSSPLAFLVRVLLLCGTCDLPAKCIMLNMVQFNGMFGCPKCLQPGKSMKTGKGSVWVFPFDSKNSDGPKRNHADTKKDAESAHAITKTVKGIKGPSWLSYVQQDLIRGTAIDFMHTGFLGIVRRLLKLWFDSSYSREMFSLYKYVNKVDERLLSIRPPNFISRIPRSIANHKKYWKASECRSWLYYYSLPVLLGIMEEQYLEHYMLFVESAYTLNLQSISQEQVYHSQRLLLQFVCMFNALYGERHMSANLHQLLHLADAVRDVGPLWVSSCFSFEDFNGRLLKLFHGTQHPELQIVDAVATLAKLPSLNYIYCQHRVIGEFLCKLSKLHSSATDIKLTGFMPSASLSVEQMTAFQEALPEHQTPRTFSLFSRLQRGLLTLPSQSCKAVEKRNSYTVQCTYNGRAVIGQIHLFIKNYSCDCKSHGNTASDCAHTKFAVLKELGVQQSLLPVNSYGSDCSQLLFTNQLSGYFVIEVDCIDQILVCTEVGGKVFVTQCPNKCERD